MCEYLGVLATVRAREFWMCWSLFICRAVADLFTKFGSTLLFDGIS